MKTRIRMKTPTTTTGTAIINQKWCGDDEYLDESLEIARRGPGRAGSCEDVCFEIFLALLRSTSEILGD